MSCRAGAGLRFLVLLVLLAGALAVHAQDARLTQAREQLTQGRAAEAVRLLEPLEADLAGDRDYNILFAHALLDVGLPARALFPINRMLRRDPNDPAGLLLLSRARIALGQAQPAREALERARKLQQPPEVAQRIDQYLSVIAAAEEAGTTRVGGHIEVAFGHDTNVNSATGASRIALPVFGGAIGTLNAAAQKQGDNFFSLAGTVGLKHSLTANLALVGALSGSQRWNDTENAFDLRTLDGSLGLRYTHGRHEWTGVFSGQTFDVDYQTFRHSVGGSVQWRYALAERTEISLFGQLARLTYPSQGLRDADRSVVGVAFAHAVGREKPPIVFASAYAGRENERNSGVEFFGHRLWGVRFGAEKAITDRFTISASVGYEERDYGGVDPLFLVSRDDEQWDFRLAMLYVLSQRWQLIPQLTHTYTRSNIELNKYRRTALFLALRWLF